MQIPSTPYIPFRVALKQELLKQDAKLNKVEKVQAVYKGHNMIRNITRKQFLLRMNDDSDNSFAYTFLERCDKQNLWPDAIGNISGGNLTGGYVGEVAGQLFSLKLLYVFKDSRARGYGDKLVTNAFWYGYRSAKYIKIVAEANSWKFYNSLGYKSYGAFNAQGDHLIIGKYNRGYKVHYLDYDNDDPIIKRVMKEYY